MQVALLPACQIWLTVLGTRPAQVLRGLETHRDDVMLVQEAGKAEVGTAYSFWTGAWDGKDAARFCTAGGSSIQVDLPFIIVHTPSPWSHSRAI